MQIVADPFPFSSETKNRRHVGGIEATLENNDSEVCHSRHYY